MVLGGFDCYLIYISISDVILLSVYFLSMLGEILWAFLKAPDFTIVDA